MLINTFSVGIYLKTFSIIIVPEKRTIYIVEIHCHDKAGHFYSTGLKKKKKHE
jgi:hypothetical protein